MSEYGTPKDAEPFIRACADLEAENVKMRAALAQAIAYIEYVTAYKGCMTVEDVEKARESVRATSVLSIGHHAGHTFATINLDKARAALAKARQS
jgi:hypothetical protein